jgi:hypothetical protein
MPTLLVAHLQNRTSPFTSQVLQKSHQANAQRQTRNDNNKHDRKEGRSANSRFAKAGVSCFYDSEVLNSSFVHLIKFSAENPRLRKAAKRCASA